MKNGHENRCVGGGRKVLKHINTIKKYYSTQWHDHMFVERQFNKLYWELRVSDLNRELK